MEPGKLDEVAIFAKRWFQEYLVSQEFKNKSDTVKPHIDSYSFGHIIIDNIEYHDDLIVFPDKIKSFWWRNDGHTLTIEDLDNVLEYKPDVLIVGIGYSGKMHIKPSVKIRLKQEGIKLIEDLTGNAVKLFNKYIQHKTKVAGAFHLTC